MGEDEGGTGGVHEDDLRTAKDARGVVVNAKDEVARGSCGSGGGGGCGWEVVGGDGMGGCRGGRCRTTGTEVGAESVDLEAEGGEGGADEAVEAVVVVGGEEVEEDGIGAGWWRMEWHINFFFFLYET